MLREFAKEFYDLTSVTLGAAALAIIGAIGGLAFAEKPTRGQSVFIVFCGIGTGCAGSAIIVGYWKVDPLVGAGVAFFLGICAMPLLGLLFGVIETLRKKRLERIADGIINKGLGPPSSPASREDATRPPAAGDKPTE